MKQFKNILLIAPFDKPLLNQATALLNTSQSRMTLMSVVPELEMANITTNDGKKVDLQSLLENELHSEIEKTTRSLKSCDVRVKSIVATGNHAFIEVIKQVQAKKHDLVMMLADGINSVRDQLFGTLSMHLMRKCPSAVWVVKPSKRRKLRNVFAAVDPDSEDPIRDKLNVEVLNRAAGIAHNNGAKLQVVHAWNTLGGNVTRSRRWMSKQEVRLYVEKVAEAHRNQLHKLLEKHLDGSQIVHMLQGHPATVISEIIGDLNGDLLVMGTICRTGIPGFFIGNTAETLLNQVDCSVLTVKPKGFVSPVCPS